MKNQQELVAPISFSKLGDCAYITTGCHKNKNMIWKFLKNVL